MMTGMGKFPGVDRISNSQMSLVPQGMPRSSNKLTGGEVLREYAYTRPVFYWA
jgi:hypothetical protein